jgi:hypothetical protein
MRVTPVNLLALIILGCIGVGVAVPLAVAFFRVVATPEEESDSPIIRDIERRNDEQNLKYWQDREKARK